LAAVIHTNTEMGAVRLRRAGAGGGCQRDGRKRGQRDDDASESRVKQCHRYPPKIRARPIPAHGNVSRRPPRSQRNAGVRTFPCTLDTPDLPRAVHPPAGETATRNGQEIADRRFVAGAEHAKRGILRLVSGEKNATPRYPRHRQCGPSARLSAVTRDLRIGIHRFSARRAT
jgi:hypothetical protein